MQSIIKELTQIVSDAFEKCGYDRELGTVSVSDRIDLCQFQCNGSFDAAKRFRKAPFIISDEIAAALRENTVFRSVESVKPGFINMTLTDNALLEKVVEITSDAHMGLAQHKEETIVLDYGGPNVAKPLHIGHLRAAIIGESLKRIARAMGVKVISDVHLGDWGLQIGLVITELEYRNPQWRCFSDDFDEKNDKIAELNADDLNEIYPLASKKSKEDEEYKNKARAVTAQLQNGKEGYIALWKEIMRVSVSDLKENYKKLNVDFDLWYGESDAEKYVPELLNKLEEKSLLVESDGAMVVDVSLDTDKAPVPPVLIKKSDNSNIYATTDLATIIQRQADFNPSKIWYVVDKRQSLHFTQVFRCAQKAQLVSDNCELIHLGFGTMNGSDGKPYKTRDGGVMKLSDFLDTIISAAGEKMSSEAFDSEEEKAENARKIAVAAIKFGDLSNHRLKDYIFDIDKFLSFEGKTGTYLIYMVTRINSIFKKLGIEEPQETKIAKIYTDIEREILLNILLTCETFRHSFEEKAPNYICDNAYKLASLFSAFYHDNHIATEQDEEKRSSWISLCTLVRKMLLLHLDVLGIEQVDKM